MGPASRLLPGVADFRFKLVTSSESVIVTHEGTGLREPGPLGGVCLVLNKCQAQNRALWGPLSLTPPTAC